jgi:hypothetical protein
MGRVSTICGIWIDCPSRCRRARYRLLFKPCRNYRKEIRSSPWSKAFGQPSKSAATWLEASRKSKLRVADFVRGGMNGQALSNAFGRRIPIVAAKLWSAMAGHRVDYSVLPTPPQSKTVSSHCTPRTGILQEGRALLEQAQFSFPRRITTIQTGFPITEHGF